MGDKNPKKQKKAKRAVEKFCMAQPPVDQSAERSQNSRPKNQSRGR